MNKPNNKGFTLIEMVVVMAVSGIFISMVMLILASSMNLFTKSKDEKNIFSDTVIIENMFTTFIDEVNNDGEKILIDLKDDEENITYIKSNNGDYIITIYYDENKITMESPMDNPAYENDKQIVNKEYLNIEIDVNLKNVNVLIINLNDEKLVYNIIGGVGYVE